MLVIKATNKEKQNLEGTYKNGSQLIFTLDGNGNNIVGLGVLTDPDFEDIHELLTELPQIEYVQPINN